MLHEGRNRKQTPKRETFFLSMKMHAPTLTIIELLTKQMHHGVVRMMPRPCLSVYYRVKCQYMNPVRILPVHILELSSLFYEVQVDRTRPVFRQDIFLRYMVGVGRGSRSQEPHNFGGETAKLLHPQRSRSLF